MDVEDVTLVWGDPSLGKAALRDESLERHLAGSLSERLAAALSLLRPRDEPG